VRDEHDGHATLSRRQIERYAMRVAVIRSHRETVATASEDVEITRVIADELGYAKHLEEFVSPVKPPRDPAYAPARRREVLDLGERRKSRGVQTIAKL
jgi:hypothetical protein